MGSRRLPAEQLAKGPLPVGAASLVASVGLWQVRDPAPPAQYFVRGGGQGERLSSGELLMSSQPWMIFPFKSFNEGAVSKRLRSVSGLGPREAD